MSTVPTAPETPRFSRTSVGLLIGAVVVIIALAVPLLRQQLGGSSTDAPSSLPSPSSAVASPPPPPASVLKYTEKDVEQLRRLDRLQWEHERQLEQVR
jgi:hypothetical protein